jgi:hypothetical protein
MTLRRVVLSILLSTFVWAQTAPSTALPEDKSPAPQAQMQQDEQSKTPTACPCCVKTAQMDGAPMQCPMMAKGAKPGQKCCTMGKKGMQCGKDTATCCAEKGGCCSGGKMMCDRAAKNAKRGQGCCGMTCPMMQPGN